MKQVKVVCLKRVECQEVSYNDAYYCVSITLAKRVRTTISYCKDQNEYEKKG
jgi:hypothetical protein